MLALHALSPVDSSSSFALNLLLIVCFCIYRVMQHPNSDLAIMFPNRYTFICLFRTHVLSRRHYFLLRDHLSTFRGASVGNGIPIDKFDGTSEVNARSYPLKENANKNWGTPLVARFTCVGAGRL